MSIGIRKKLSFFLCRNSHHLPVNVKIRAVRGIGYILEVSFRTLLRGEESHKGNRYFIWYCLCDPANYRLADSNLPDPAFPDISTKAVYFP